MVEPTNLKPRRIRSRLSGVGLGGARGNLRRGAPGVLARDTVHEAPLVGGETAELVLHAQEGAGVRDRGGDLEPVADDARVAEQRFHPAGRVARHARRIEAVERLAVGLAPGEHEVPAEPRLRPFEHEELEQPRARRAAARPTRRRGRRRDARCAPRRSGPPPAGSRTRLVPAWPSSRRARPIWGSRRSGPARCAGRTAGRKPAPAPAGRSRRARRWPAPRRRRTGRRSAR